MKVRANKNYVYKRGDLIVPLVGFMCDLHEPCHPKNVPDAHCVSNQTDLMLVIGPGFKNYQYSGYGYVPVITPRGQYYASLLWGSYFPDNFDCCLSKFKLIRNSKE